MIPLVRQHSNEALGGRVALVPACRDLADQELGLGQHVRGPADERRDAQQLDLRYAGARRIGSAGDDGAQHGACVRVLLGGEVLRGEQAQELERARASEEGGASGAGGLSR